MSVKGTSDNNLTYNADPNANLREALFLGNEQNTGAADTYGQGLQDLIDSGAGDISVNTIGMRDFVPKYDAAYGRYDSAARPLIENYGTMDQNVYDRMKGQYYAGLDSGFSDAGDNLQAQLAQRGLSGSGVFAQSMGDLAQNRARAGAETGVRAYNDAIGQSDINRSNKIGGYGNLFNGNLNAINGGVNAEASRVSLANQAALGQANLQADNYNRQLQALGLARDNVLNNSQQRLSNLSGYAGMGTNLLGNSNNLLGSAGSSYNTLGGLAGGTGTTLGSLGNSYNAAMNGAYATQANQQAEADAGKGSMFGSVLGGVGSIIGGI